MRFIRSMMASAVAAAQLVDDAARRRGTPRDRRTRTHSGSWLTITIVCPNSSTALRMNPRISALAFESRFPVGSSAKMMSGWLTNAPRHGDALLLTAGQLSGLVRQTIAEVHRLDDAVEARRARASCPASDNGKRDVLRRGERRDQVVRLEDEPDVVTPDQRELLLRAGADLAIAEEDLPGGDTVEPGEAVQQRRLSRTRRAHDRRVLVRLERGVDLVERVDRPCRRCRRSWRRATARAAVSVLVAVVTGRPLLVRGSSDTYGVHRRRLRT